MPRAKTEKSPEFPDTAGLPKIPASLVLSEELLKDPPRPVRAIKELQEPPHTSSSLFRYSL
jgi:hypothetical protein